MKPSCFRRKWNESESEVAQSCPTLCNPVDYNLPAFSVHGIFQARILEWVVISFSRRSSQHRDWTQVSRIVGRCFTIWATGKSTSTKNEAPHTSCWLVCAKRRKQAFWPNPSMRPISLMQGLSPHGGLKGQHDLCPGASGPHGPFSPSSCLHCSHTGLHLSPPSPKLARQGPVSPPLQESSVHLEYSVPWRLLAPKSPSRWEPQCLKITLLSIPPYFVLFFPPGCHLLAWDIIHSLSVYIINFPRSALAPEKKSWDILFICFCFVPCLVPRTVSDIYQVINTSVWMNRNWLFCVSNSHGHSSLLGSIRIPGDLIHVSLSGGDKALKAKKRKAGPTVTLNERLWRPVDGALSWGPRVVHLQKRARPTCCLLPTSQGDAERLEEMMHLKVLGGP